MQAKYRPLKKVGSFIHRILRNIFFKKTSPVVLYEAEHRPNNYFEDISIIYRFDIFSDLAFVPIACTFL